MHRPAALIALALAGLTLALATPALAQPAAGAKPEAAKTAAAKPEKPARGGALGGFGGNSKEPIRVDANKLEVFDKEGRAVYSGDVVAVQGASTLRCTQLTVFYEQKGAKDEAKKDDAKPAAPSAAAAPSSGAIKQLDCAGPVSVVSGTQTATANSARYDAVAEKVYMNGNVVLADGANIQRGEKVVYDTKTGVANIDPGAGQRVQGIFTPGSEEKKGDKAADKTGAAAPKQRPAATQ